MSLTRRRFCWAAWSFNSAERRRALYLVMPAASSIRPRRSVGLLGQDEADLALLDDGVGLGADTGIHENLVNVAKAARTAVHQVLALARAIEPAGDDDLAQSTRRGSAVHLRQAQVDLGDAHRRTGITSGEDEILHLLAAQALGALLPKTQPIASDILLLPQPLGPTMAVTPWWKGQLGSLSPKLLNPKMSTCSSFTSPPSYG